MGKGRLRRDTSMLIFKWVWPICAALLNSHWKGNAVVFYQFPLSILHCIRIPHQELAVFHPLNSKYMGHLVMWRFSQEISCHPLFFFIQVPSCGKPQSKSEIHVEGEERFPPHLNCILGVFLAHNRKYIRICIFLLLRHLKKNKSTPSPSPGWTYVPNCNFPSFFWDGIKKEAGRTFTEASVACSLNLNWNKVWIPLISHQAT